MYTYWKRGFREEMEWRCRLVDGRYLHEGRQKLMDNLGADRATRTVPLDVSSNPLRRSLNVTSILYTDRAVAVQGMTAAIAEDIGDASSPLDVEEYAEIGCYPMPTSLVEGGGGGADQEHGGLRDMLDYLQACDFSALAIGWDDDSERPYVQTILPADLDAEYRPGRPLAPAVVRWHRTRDVKGKKTQVVDEYDLTDPQNPVMRVRRVTQDGSIGAEITGQVDSLADVIETLSGDGYWWRYAPSKNWPIGRPFIPIVVYGSMARAFQKVSMTEATVTAATLRTSALTTALDTGFPKRCVKGLTTGTSSDSEGEGTSTMPGDVTVFRDTDDTRPGEHWEWGPGGDPEAMYRLAKEYDREVLEWLGFPVDQVTAGGEPLEYVREAQERAIRQWYNTCRMGDGVLLKRIVAMINRARDKRHPEGPFRTLYREEIERMLAKRRGIQEPEKETKPKADEKTEETKKEA